MTKKKPWKDHAIEHIRKTGQCPGDPSFGVPTDQVTEEEFQMSLQAGGVHPYADCHYLDEMLGTVPPPGMRAIETDDPRITEADVQQAKEALEDNDTRTVGKLKKNLKVYVDMIKFKDKGVLYVPEPLLRLDSYIKKFFDVKE